MRARDHDPGIGSSCGEKPSHTPGPWAASLEYSNDMPGPYLCVASEPHEIAQVLCSDTFTEGLANARLISAAPDLLEALKELHLKTVVGTDDERYAALNQAWAAIAKAEGLS